MRFHNRVSILGLAVLLPGLVTGGEVPGYGGLRVIWQDNFVGGTGSPVNGDVWNVANVRMNNNNEAETYSGSSRNLQLSGGGTVQLVPWRDAAAGWTSARIESKATFTPEPGRVTQVEASLRTGANSPSAQQGIWPAFWLLGDAIRHGTPWPTCGELDVLEQRNGVMTAFGTAHCGTYPGGICAESVGRGTTAPIPDNAFHVWALRWDRRPADWSQGSITWYRDGQPFYTLTGAALGDQAVWSTLAHSPYFIILNVAVGGDL